jgi:hypothetical protein
VYLLLMPHALSFAKKNIYVCKMLRTRALARLGTLAAREKKKPFASCCAMGVVFAARKGL